MAAQNFMKRRRLTPFCCRAPKNDSFGGSIRSSFLGVSRTRSTCRRSNTLPHARIATVYHQRRWKDVTKFTDVCDPAHEHSVHLLRWTDVVRGFLFFSRSTAMSSKPTSGPEVVPRIARQGPVYPRKSIAVQQRQTTWYLNLYSP